MFLRPFRPILASALGGWLLIAPAASAQPVGPLAVPPEPGWGEIARDAAIATAASAAILGLAFADGGNGPLGRTGQLGQFAMVAGAVALPPAALVLVSRPAHPIESYAAAVSGGLAGLAVGFATSRRNSTDPHAPSDAMIQLAAMAVGQGLASAAVHHLYLRHRPEAEGLNVLPPDSERTDDPIDDWNLRREREQR